jgi:NAD(P)-dependent dehydrogenase (short-subunit alcohol dehydrogenase family)
MPTAFITGGTKRIGRAVSDDFIRHGYDVILHEHNPSSHKNDLVSIYKDSPQKVSFVDCDLTDENAVHDMVQNIVKHHGVPDAFVHTASIFEKDFATDFTSHLWDKHLKIHCFMPAMIIRYFYNHRRNAQKLSAVLFADQRIDAPNPDFFSYTASKMLCGNLIKLLAQSLSPDMRVNGISPGPTLKNIRQSDAEFMKQVDMTPLKTQISDTDLAQAVLFLTQCETITGQIITIDSGQSLDWRTESFMQVRE